MVEKGAVKRHVFILSPFHLKRSTTTPLIQQRRSRSVSQPMTMRTDYLLPCILNPIQNCALWGGIFVGIDILQGTVSTSPPSLLRNFGLYAGGLWCYRASMCPMEAIHGRQSLLQ